MAHDVYGAPDVLTLHDLDQPTARDDGVLVRVHAAALNVGDLFLTTGEPYVMRAGTGLRRPRNPVRGMDFAGRVETVGRNVTGVRPGDDVFGYAMGTLAEYVNARATAVAPKPTSLTYEQAAAVPIAGVTALVGLRDHARLRPGQHLLVNGASGGIGTFAVQIAKAMGAEVTGVCGTRNVELVRSLGADHVIDYTREDVTRGDRRYDAILDNAGNHSLSACRRVLTRDGVLLPNNGHGGRWFGTLGRVLGALATSVVVRQRLRPFVAITKTKDLVALTKLIESGAVTPVIDRTYPLVDAPEALRYLQTGHARGKLVVTV